jgi:hypothetical protein
MKIIFLSIIFYVASFAQSPFFLLMGDKATYGQQTLDYQTRVEAAGGEIINLEAVNDLYLAGIDSLKLAIGSPYGLIKDANNKITKYFDLSSNEIDFIQTDTSGSPIFLLNAVNGYPSAIYVNDHLKNGSLLVSKLFGTNTGTLSFVLKQSGGSANNGLWNLVAPNNTNQVAIFATFSNTIYFDFGSEAGGGRVSVAQPSGWDDTYHILQFVRNGTIAEIWVDGVKILDTTFSDDLDNTATTPVSIPQLGLRSINFVGEIAETIITNTAGDAAKIRTFLANRYGL